MNDAKYKVRAYKKDQTGFRGMVKKTPNVL